MYGIPFAFESAGIVLSAFLVLLMSGIAMITMQWIVESLGRATALENAAKSAMLRDEDDIDIEGRNVEEDLVSADSDFADKVTPLFDIRNQKFELNDLLARLAGRRTGQIAAKVYEIAVLLFILGVLWLYAAVFASSLVASVPLPGLTWGSDVCGGSSYDWNCQIGYWIFLFIFGAVMIGLSQLDLRGQIPVQLLLTVVSLILMVVLFITCAFALMERPYDSTKPHNNSPPYYMQQPWIKLSGFSMCFTTAVFAMQIHMSVPGLSMLIKKKKYAAPSIAGAMATVSISYIVLGIVTSLYFGSAVDSLITLNWKNYYNNSNSAFRWLTFGISRMLLLFPPVTVSAAYPMYVVTGAETLVGVLPKSAVGPYGRIFNRLLRLLLAVIPLTLAVFMRNISSILNVTGLSAFAMMYFGPCLMQYRGKSLCMRRIGSSKTPYSNFLSSDWVVLAIFVFAVAAFLFSVTEVTLGIFNAVFPAHAIHIFG